MYSHRKRLPKIMSDGLFEEGDMFIASVQQGCRAWSKLELGRQAWMGKKTHMIASSHARLPLQMSVKKGAA